MNGWKHLETSTRLQSVSQHPHHQYTTGQAFVLEVPPSRQNNLCTKGCQASTSFNCLPPAHQPNPCKSKMSKVHIPPALREMLFNTPPTTAAKGPTVTQRPHRQTLTPYKCLGACSAPSMAKPNGSCPTCVWCLPSPHSSTQGTKPSHPQITLPPAIKLWEGGGRHCAL